MGSVGEVRPIHHTTCPWCGSSDLQERFKVRDRSGSGEYFPIVDCKSCGFVFTQDVPPPEAIGKYYEFESYISHQDSRDSIFDKIYHRIRQTMLNRKFRLIAKYADPGPKALLDYGAGTGYFLQYMKEKGWDVTGVEMSEQARSHAAAEFGLDILAPEDFTNAAQKYQVITLWHVLEHLYDFKDKLEQFKRLLTDRGILVLALPNHTSWDAQRLGETWAAYDAPRHLWHFSPEVMEKIANKYGYSIVKMKPMPFDAFYVSILSDQLRGKGTSAFLLGGMKGLISNLNSIFNPGKASSIIYILKKK